jgi:hypothetical protein
MNIRLLPVLGMTGLLSIALAGSAVAGGWPVPGTSKTTDTSASAELVGATTIVCIPDKGCYPEPSEFASVYVDRGLHTFKPRGGETLVQQSGTMLMLSYYTASGINVFGCWMIADGDFTVAQDLSSASLVTTIPVEPNCQGLPVKVSSANVVTSMGVGPRGGGGTGQIRLNLNWIYRGVVGHARNDTMLRCGNFQTVGGDDFDHATATAKGQITGASAGMTSDFASIGRSSGHSVVSGVPVDACFF